MLLVPAGDDARLARTIAGLVADPAERDRLGMAARHTVAEHFSWQHNGARTAAVYREVLERSRT
jgi:glycosyltransferase involved in cell wall biosynthesis